MKDSMFSLSGWANAVAGIDIHSITTLKDGQERTNCSKATPREPTYPEANRQTLRESIRQKTKPHHTLKTQPPLSSPTPGLC